MAMSEPVIDVSALTRRFGAKTVLAAVSLTLPRGAVYGLVGANGAGKTTLIKHILGLLRVESGSVRVFGLDPVADPVGVLSRIGYLSEDNDLPGWMRVDELLRYSRAFYPLGRWVRRGAAPGVRPRPHGENQAPLEGAEGAGGTADRAGVSARAPGARRAVVRPRSHRSPRHSRAILRTIAAEGRTVLFSSHLLEEVERVADHVTMISQGKIALSAPLPAIKASHRCLTVHFAEPRQEPPALAGVLRWEGGGQEWMAVAHGGSGELQATVAGWGARIVAERIPSLDEIFVAHVGMTGMAAAPAAEA